MLFQNLISLLAFFLIKGSNYAQTVPKDVILGVRHNLEKDEKVQIYKQDDKYYGKLIRQPPKKILKILSQN